MATPTHTVDAAVYTGHYARKQLLCRSRLIAWSHGSRFRQARKLVEPYAGGRILDYGCGDGSFLGMVAGLFQESVGADLAEDQVLDCETRLQHLGKLRFCHTSRLPDAVHGGRYDVVTCMETLEHCREAMQRHVLAELRRLVSESGTVVISVPIEVGPTLPLKQAVRRVAGWRGLGQYRFTEVYTWKQLFKMTFAGAATRIPRPLYGECAGDPMSGWHGHKGFNWKCLVPEIESLFEIRRRLFSPMNWSGGLFSSQCWMVCSPRRRAELR